MLGHGAKFGHKKEQAIAALLSHRSVEEAARAVGISANTLLRWAKEPEFTAAYEEARLTVFSQSIGRLQVASGAAVSTVLKIMLDPNVPAGTRLRAPRLFWSRRPGPARWKTSKIVWRSWSGRRAWPGGRVSVQPISPG
jgi:hypothetical protein